MEEGGGEGYRGHRRWLDYGGRRHFGCVYIKLGLIPEITVHYVKLNSAEEDGAHQRAKHGDL